MAYQFWTSFDHYTDPTQRWDTVSGTATISSANARFGGAHSLGCKINQNSYLAKLFTSSQPTLIVGFAIQLAALPSSSTDYFINFVDTGVAQQITLVIKSDGTLQFFRDTPNLNQTIGSGSSTKFTAGVWHYLECLVTVNNTTGVANCWLDGVQVLTNSGVNTRSGASTNNSAKEIRIGEMGNNVSGPKVDDVYMFDGTGGSFNNVLGDRRIICLTANAAGSFTQFSLSGAASNDQAVNDIPPNDNTSYVSDATVGHRDSYNFEDIALNGNADGLTIVARIAKDDAGSHTVNLTATDTGSDTLSSAITVPGSYAFVDSGAIATSPNGGAALSQTVINRMEFGIKIAT